ncbi:MAG: type II toxin-antitoxin system ParD family antitoxin [Terricaulis sp.]|nr:type II toxin-antitoxin system ParD family antitoxin [Terricaulis sp.]
MITLPEPLAAWVEAQVRAGRYGSASEYVCDLIRRDQAARVGKLQAMIRDAPEGEETGPMDAEGLLADMHAARNEKA